MAQTGVPGLPSLPDDATGNTAQVRETGASGGTEVTPVFGQITTDHPARRDYDDGYPGGDTKMNPATG